MTADLFEPRRSECAALAMMHAAKSEKFSRAAAVFKARGWDSLCREYHDRAVDHELEAQALADYAFLLEHAKVNA